MVLLQKLPHWPWLAVTMLVGAVHTQHTVAQDHIRLSTQDDFQIVNDFLKKNKTYLSVWLNRDFPHSKLNYRTQRFHMKKWAVNNGASNNLCVVPESH